ncbi:SDR family oxidoreductase [Azospirillum sp. RWY-5-1]|uniref:SDR family oxidoreductase n=1 Tax=Azospirillum oleiclasticum TaxID=2735135 RepID=A0ABX2TLR1_9PROT|nr:SDR family oxidoreductase [Azospirillum oleiclasticum]NYZ17568.1 SDR family oxidoreductase [Azospirillum oleiclasticum]NYZ24670.1 SDR family oxidoreductase [Azospirillum oleiclasticum]
MTRLAVFGATSAIAGAVARLYAAEGASLFLVARNAARLEALAADLRARGAAAVTTAVADLNDLDRHPELVERARAALDGLDAVLIAHGTLSDQAACEADAGLARAELTTNFLGPVSLLTALAPVMERQNRGSIAVIGSVAGDRGRGSNYVYGSAKGGLGVFVQGLRHRLGRSNVAVTLVKPGFVDTPMTAALPKGGPLWAKPERVAADIRRALDRGPAVLYTPWFWRWILLIIRLLPDAVFRRTRL